MNVLNRTILIISAEQGIAQGCIAELAIFGGRYQTIVVRSMKQARKEIMHTRPAVIFLDESAIKQPRDGESLESAAESLIETAPVVVAGSTEKQGLLGFLITSGAADFVVRTSHFLPIAAGMLDRRVRLAERMTGMIQFPGSELPGDFGEVLRHEVNNPLTGILGNTELLLARRENLPPAAIERLQTIAELAVRLRETVRRLSNAWDESREHARPA